MMKFLKRMTVGTAVLSLLYLTGCLILPHTQYSYRMWTDIVGKGMAAFVLPLLLLVLAGIWLWKLEKLHIALKGILTAAAAAVYLYLGFWAFLFILFSVKEEKQLTRHLLVVNESEFLGASHYEYYEPAAVVLRKPGELTVKAKEEYLQEKYGDFVEEFSALDVQVYGSGMALEDNFAECVTVYLAKEGMQEHRMERDFEIAENHCGMDSWLYLELKGKGDIRDFSEEISGLIGYMMSQTAFFEKHRGVIGFYCKDGEDNISGIVPFGKLDQWERLEEEYYLDAELVEERVTAEYEDSVRFWEEYEEQLKESEQYSAGTKVHVQTEMIAENPVEKAAEAIYQEVLAAEGYSYKPCHNAKGNFYLELGEETADGSSADKYLYTLVYDRSSKNGKCELFVLYREEYCRDEDGSLFLNNTVILNTYAAETGSDRVIASGKKAWEDVGTKEYQEAAGEK